jgi:hypothetical protein
VTITAKCVPLAEQALTCGFTLGRNGAERRAVAVTCNVPMFRHRRRAGGFATPWGS